MFVLRFALMLKNRVKIEFEKEIEDLIDQCNSGEFSEQTKGKKNNDAIHYISDSEEYDRLFSKEP
jgi:hypothetical protein